jgi:hypothetical protein
MGVVMITCPNTGRAVHTGIETDQRSFDALPDTLSRSKCPHCGARTCLVDARGLVGCEWRGRRAVRCRATNKGPREARSLAALPRASIRRPFNGVSLRAC